MEGSPRRDRSAGTGVPAARPLPQQSDVVVVGAGTAGAAVAARLAEAGVGTVTVLEAGPDHGALDGGRWPRELLDASRLPLSYDWGYVGRAADGRVLPLERARVVGGCSSHNGCTQSWGWRGDYDAWAAAGCDGWSGAELEPCLERASRALRVRRYAEEEVQPFQRAFLAAVEDVGVPRTDDLDDLDGGVGVSTNPVNIVDGVRFNSAFAYLDPVRGHSNLQVFGHVLVDRLELDGDRVRGLMAYADGRLQRIATDLVVLCGGVYGSPEVLMRSGIGDPATLEAAGIACRHALPAVGRDVRDHVAVTLEFAATRALAEELRDFAGQGWMPDEQCIAKLDSGRTSDAPYDVHVYPWVEDDPTTDHGWRCVFPVGLLRPRSRGGVAVRSPNAMVRAHVDHGYLRDDGDVDVLIAALEQVDEIRRQEPLAGALGPSLHEAPRAQGRAAVRQWILRSHQHYWHPTGGCCMGPDERSVVGPRGGVHGLAGVMVADGSVFPEPPRATPATPTVALAERMVDLLLGDLRGAPSTPSTSDGPRAASAAPAQRP